MHYDVCFLETVKLKWFGFVCLKPSRISTKACQQPITIRMGKKSVSTLTIESTDVLK